MSSLHLAWMHTRRSMDKQEASLEQQRAECQRRAIEMGAQIVREFTSHAGHVSGLDLEQDRGFQEMCRAAEAPNHGIKYLFIYDTARFGRMRARRKIYWEEMLRNCGISIVYVGENFRNDGSLGDELLQYISHAEAHQYSLRLSKSTIRGCKHHAQLGRSCGGSAPYGFARAIVDQHGQVVKVLARGEHKADKQQHVVWVLGATGEVDVVVWIFERFANGNGLGAIVDELNRREVPSPYGKTWAKSTVRAILLNPAYQGKRVYFRRAYHERGEGAKRHVRPRDEWIEVQNAHPVIVAKELFDKVQARFRVRKMGEGRRHDSQHLLSGFIKCARCGHTFGARLKSEAGRKVLVYECLGYSSKGKHVCSSCTIKAGMLDDFTNKAVAEALVRLKGSLRVKTRLQGRLDQLGGADGAVRAKAIEQELAQKKTELGNVGKALRLAPESPTVHAELKKVEEELRRLEGHLKEAQNATQSPIDAEAASREMLSYLAEATSLYRHGTIQERKAVLRAFLAKVEVRPQERQARFKFYKVPVFPIKKEAGPKGAGGSSYYDGCGGWI